MTDQVGARFDTIFRDSVDLSESAGRTHFVMDAYTTVKLLDPGTETERVTLYVAQRREFQELTTKAYQGFQREVEAAVAP